MDTKHMAVELPATSWPHVREFFEYLLAQPAGTKLDTKDLSADFYKERFDDFADYYRDRYGDWLWGLSLYYINNEAIQRYFLRETEEYKPKPDFDNTVVTAVIFTRLKEEAHVRNESA